MQWTFKILLVSVYYFVFECKQFYNLIPATEMEIIPQTYHLTVQNAARTHRRVSIILHFFFAFTLNARARVWSPDGHNSPAKFVYLLDHSTYGLFIFFLIFLEFSILLNSCQHKTQNIYKMTKIMRLIIFSAVWFCSLLTTQNGQYQMQFTLIFTIIATE